jgi:hypothetical protein
MFLIGFLLLVGGITASAALVFLDCSERFVNWCMTACFIGLFLGLTSLILSDAKSMIERLP